MYVQRNRRIRRAAAAFTLVEILIVVIILGILGSVIIGLFQNGARDASTNALRDNLRSMRSALQVYIAQHGSYPDPANFIPQMTQFTDASGATSTTKTTTHQYGPYIMDMPTLPLGTEKGKVGVTGMTYTPGFGWGYDPTEGKFKANLPDTDVDENGNKLNTY